MLTKTKKLVDSNVLVYAYDANSSFHERATAFLTDPSFDYYIATKNISEYFAVLSKIGEPFAKVWQFYVSAKSNCTILYPTPASLAIFENLMQKYQPKGNRTYDLEIVSIALANQVTDIATHNIKDFANITEINVHPI